MWIFTNFGFVSAVGHRDDKDMLMVRAREPGVIDELCGRHGVRTAVAKTPDADYLYRAEIDKKTFAKMIAAEIESIDYANFKNSFRAAKPENTRLAHDALMDVWCVMNRLQHAVDAKNGKKAGGMP